MKTKKIKILEGLYAEQKEIVRDVFSGNYNFITVKAGRQSGKSYTFDRTAYGFALKVKTEILWITPSHGQSCDAMERIEEILKDKHIWHKPKHSPDDRRITFTNGSRIRFLSAERFDNLRGKHPKHLIILDEFAFFKEGAWEFAIKPYFIANKNLICLVASTPASKNHFYDLWQRGLTKAKNYKNHRLHYTMNPATNIEFIEEERKSLPKQVFKQEYEGEFVFGSSQVFGEFSNVQRVRKWVKPNHKHRKYYFGIDWATGDGEDDTVIAIIDDMGNIVYIEEMDRVNNVKQVNRIMEIIKVYNANGYSENNSLGSVCNDIMAENGMDFWRFTTSQSSKDVIVKQLIRDINENVINLPHICLCSKLDSQMTTFMVDRSKNGKLSYHHAPGAHDDYVDAVMLANQARVDECGIGTEVIEEEYEQDDFDPFDDEAENDVF